MVLGGSEETRYESHSNFPVHTYLWLCRSKLTHLQNGERIRPVVSRFLGPDEFGEDGSPLPNLKPLSSYVDVKTLASFNKPALPANWDPENRANRKSPPQIADSDADGVWKSPRRFLCVRLGCVLL